MNILKVSAPIKHHRTNRNTPNFNPKSKVVHPIGF